MFSRNFVQDVIWRCCLLWSSLVDFRCFKGIWFVDAFLLLKIIFCHDAFLLFDENYHFSCFED
jgi:hypothetical protein